MKKRSIPHWMTETEFDIYCAVCLIADAMVHCMLNGNREGWLVLSRVLRRVAHSGCSFRYEKG